MYPSEHFILGTFIAMGILTIFPVIGLTGFFIILAASVLIDVDHYLYYVFRFKDLSLKRAYDWFIKENKKKVDPKRYKHIIIFHGLEFLVILVLIASQSFIFLMILYGVLIHLLLDLGSAAYGGWFKNDPRMEVAIEERFLTIKNYIYNRRLDKQNGKDKKI